MVDAGIFTVLNDVVVRAGVNVNAVSVTEAEYNKYILAVEAYINAVTRYDWSTWYTTVTTAVTHAAVKHLLKEASGCLGAIYMIESDMSGYTNTEEATAMCDILEDKATKALTLLADQDVRKFMEVTA